MKMLRWYIPVVIIVATVNLRPALLTLGPVLPAVQRALDLAPFAAGLLTSLPILALGIASAVAVPVGRRLGWNGGLIGALLLIACGVVLRSSGSEAMLFTGALLLGLGSGLGNVFVPTLIKAHLGNHIGIAMGVYTMLLAGGALVSTAITPWIYSHFNDWKPTLEVFAIPVVIAAIIATPSLFNNLKPHAHVPGGGLYRNRLAWAVTGYMGLQSAIFYSTALWIGALMSARGMTLPEVAQALTLYYFWQFVSALVLPIALTKSSRQDLVAAACVVFAGAMVVCVLYGPLAYVNVSAGLMGLAMGAVFAVALTFQVIRARTSEVAARLSSMAQFVGYVLAAVGPLVLGLVSKSPDARLASTSWLIFLVIACAVCGWFAGKPRFVEDEPRAELRTATEKGATWRN
jgi:CP family cyanate transporter-like MFS transporter